ncbi:UDP-N-acetylglucosamine--LPS N-acetylglucosamine transferase [Ornithinimicrobium cavernae]|uniref:UDP-N-acetylglucosamine--LPS N-acetylglucosamine transferase n=1 Tax=Ornithinimicrobium cavernae TaxID=2666047 RepID=UPI000D690F43|nr:UDP-N-acetylglucosamine--LPS N-acetylglucosamine transferase [Ornithinimicrobium cavernae]
MSAVLAGEGERILLVGSSGGHLAQLMALRPWWGASDRAWCVFDGPDSRGHLKEESDVTWAHAPTTRNVPNLLRNTVLAWRLLRRFRPTTVVSTGAGVALPFFVLGRVRGVRTVYIEVYDRIDTATLTGRLCRPFTDVMCVQWDEQRHLYRDAHVIGPLL